MSYGLIIRNKFMRRTLLVRFGRINIIMCFLVEMGSGLDGFFLLLNPRAKIDLIMMIKLMTLQSCIQRVMLSSEVSMFIIQGFKLLNLKLLLLFLRLCIFLLLLIFLLFLIQFLPLLLALN